ncbi:RpiR family transcriptional regulator [Thermohydrogenium kirishiense]|nr:RpiR family transcriptional regulator [Thermohydrogenium kirishiense]
MNEKELNQLPGFLVRIRTIYSSLRDSEKKIANYINENYQDIMNLTITELAEKSGTSESAVVRLCKSLGYKGFQEFKIKAAQDVIQPSQQIHEAIEREDDLITIKEKVFNAHIQALIDTLEILSNEELEKAVDLIANANRLEIYGEGGSGVVALDAQHKFLKIGLKSFAYLDSDLKAMSASLLQKGDVVVGISHSGVSRNLIESLEIAKKAGASIIAITNYSKSLILKVSDVALFTISKETAFKSYAMSSRIAELSIIDALVMGVAFRRFEESIISIQKTRDATFSKKY